MKYLVLALIVLVTGCSTPRMVSDAELPASTNREICWRWVHEMPTLTVALIEELLRRGSITQAEYDEWDATKDTGYSPVIRPADCPSCLTTGDLMALGRSGTESPGTVSGGYGLYTVSTPHGYSTLSTTSTSVNVSHDRQ